MQLKSSLSTMVCMCGAAALLMSCSPPMQGIPSLTLVSDQNEKMAQYYTPLGEAIEEQDCLTAGPLSLIIGGTLPVQESLLARMLEENQADVLLNAEFKVQEVAFPLIFSRSCVIISGTPAKRK